MKCPNVLHSRFKLLLSYPPLLMVKDSREQQVNNIMDTTYPNRRDTRSRAYTVDPPPTCRSPCDIGIRDRGCDYRCDSHRHLRDNPRYSWHTHSQLHPSRFRHQCTTVQDVVGGPHYCWHLSGGPLCCCCDCDDAVYSWWDAHSRCHWLAICAQLFD